MVGAVARMAEDLVPDQEWTRRAAWPIGRRAGHRGRAPPIRRPEPRQVAAHLGRGASSAPTGDSGRVAERPAPATSPPRPIGPLRKFGSSAKPPVSRNQAWRGGALSLRRVGFGIIGGAMSGQASRGAEPSALARKPSPGGAASAGFEGQERRGRRTPCVLGQTATQPELAQPPPSSKARPEAYSARASGGTPRRRDVLQKVPLRQRLGNGFGPSVEAGHACGAWGWGLSRIP